MMCRLAKIMVLLVLAAMPAFAEEPRVDSVSVEDERLAELLGADEAARAAVEKEKRSVTVKTASFAMFVLGLVSLGVGVYENMVVKDERRKYEKASYDSAEGFDKQWDRVESARTTRNIFYGVGAGLVVTGVAVYFVF